VESGSSGGRGQEVNDGREGQVVERVAVKRRASAPTVEQKVQRMLSWMSDVDTEVDVRRYDERLEQMEMERRRIEEEYRRRVAKWESDRRALLEERERVLRLAEPLRKLSEAAEFFRAAVSNEGGDSVSEASVSKDGAGIGMDFTEEEERRLLEEDASRARTEGVCDKGTDDEVKRTVEGSGDENNNDGEWKLVTGRKGTREYEQNVRRRRGSGSVRRGSDGAGEEGRRDSADSRKKEE
jgi:hypothetical protein